MSKKEILKGFRSEFSEYLRPKTIGVFDSILLANGFEEYLTKAIDQTREETIESIVKYIRENLTAGESWERGDIYININNVETLGSGSFNWDNEFWDELKNNLLNNLKQ